VDATRNRVDRNWGRVGIMPMSSQSKSLRLDEVESNVHGDSTELIYTVNYIKVIVACRD
jgi:hypothetical protein